MLADDDRRIREPELAARGEAVIAGDKLVVATVDGADDQRDEQAAQSDRLREAVDARRVESRASSWGLDRRREASRISPVWGVEVTVAMWFAPRSSGLLFANANCPPHGRTAERLSRGAQRPGQFLRTPVVRAVGAIRNWLTDDGAVCQGPAVVGRSPVWRSRPG